MNISIAVLADIPELVNLLNSAYRGEASRKGWTTEADLLEGALRTDVHALTAIMLKPGSVVLKCVSPGGAIIGCVNLQKQERGLYLGMLSVQPELQAVGIGKNLLAAAEVHAKESGCAGIFMTVISVRQELIGWYRRHGYKLTGETRPMEADGRFGVPTRPLEFIIMEKIFEPAV
jgi:ribosomal protein S18 acetylase RimI-like enzyme